MNARRVLAGLVDLLVPFACLATALVMVWRFLFRHEDELTEATVRRIRHDAERAARLRELDEIPRGRRQVPEVLTRATTALSRPWDGGR